MGLALIVMAVGALLYFPIRRFIKPGKPDIDPFEREIACQCSEWKEWRMSE